uniref:Uncharacterized protein n=1 Tax=Rhizoctonia cerealis phyllomonavirus TaxID=3068671 RepID=A0AA51BTN9_9MONO|nr:MAG: hypothetical protein [Rhizoctonia cerealis phyllomonavirus]
MTKSHLKETMSVISSMMIPTRTPPSVPTAYSASLATIVNSLHIYAANGMLAETRSLGFDAVALLDRLLENETDLPSPVVPIVVQPGTIPGPPSAGLPVWASHRIADDHGYVGAWLMAALTMELLRHDGWGAFAPGDLLAKSYRAGIDGEVIELSVMAADAWLLTISSREAAAMFSRAVPGTIMCLNMHHLLLEAQGAVGDLADARRRSMSYSVELSAAALPRFPDVDTPLVSLVGLPGEAEDPPSWPEPQDAAEEWEVIEDPDTGVDLWLPAGVPRAGQSRDTRLAIQEVGTPVGQTYRSAYARRFGLDGDAHTMRSIARYLRDSPHPLDVEAVTHLALSRAWDSFLPRALSVGSPVGLTLALQAICSNWTLVEGRTAIHGADTTTTSLFAQGAVHLMVREFMARNSE